MFIKRSSSLKPDKQCLFLVPMQKVIFLVDMNAFFISCEMTRDGSLVGVPAAVAGDPKKRSGIILAANYVARSFGVKTAMVLHEALKLCPRLILVPPDHHFYHQKSEEVMQFKPVSTAGQASKDTMTLLQLTIPDSMQRLFISMMTLN